MEEESKKAIRFSLEAFFSYPFMESRSFLFFLLSD